MQAMDSSPCNGRRARPGRGAQLVCVCLLALVMAGCGRPDVNWQAAVHAGDYATARRLLGAAAPAGEARAQNALGTLCYLGLGGAVDFACAAEWFKRAALGGDPHAQRHLGSLFRQGLGVPRDELRAFGWYDAARHNGHPGAEDYMQWMTQYVGWNQQAYARRIVAEDLRKGEVSECGAGLLMSACPPGTGTP